MSATEPNPTRIPPLPPPRRRRPVRAFLRLLNRLLVLVGLALLVYVFVFPPIVRRVVSSTLADLGYPGASFDLRSTSLTGVELADIRPAGADAVAIQNAVIRFSPTEILSGRLRTIRLVGVEVPMTLRNGTIDFSLAPKPDPAAPDAGTSPDPKPITLPFTRLEVASSTLVIDWEGRQVRLPVQGSVTPDGATVALDLLTFFQGSTIPITGTLSTSGAAVDLRVTGRNLSAAGVRAAIPWPVLNTPVQASGLLDFDASYKLADGRSSAHLRLQPRNLWLAAAPSGHRLDVERVTGSVELSLLPGNRLGPVTGSLQTARVTFDDFAARDLKLSAAARDDGAVTLTTSFASDLWQLKTLTGTLTGLASPDAPIQFHGSLELAGHFPKPVTDLLADNGITLDRPAPASVRSSIRASLPRSSPAAGWRLLLPDLHLSLPPTTVVLNRQGLTLSGATLDLSASADVTADNTTVRLLPDTRLSVASVRTTAGLTATPADAANPTIAIELADLPATFAYKNDWTFHLPHLRVTLALSDLSNTPTATNVAALQGVFHISGDASAQKTTMTLLPDSIFAFDALRHGESVSVGPARFNLLPTDLPLLAGRDLSARLQSAAPVTVDAPDTKASAQSITLTATGSLAGSPTLSAELAIDHAAVAQPKWSADDISARIPFTWNATAPAQPGTFSVPSITVDNHKLPAVTGTLAIHNRQATVSATSALTKEATLTAAATAELTEAGLTGKATASLPTVTLSDPHALATFWPPANAFSLTGTLSLDGEVTFAGPLVQPRITASIKDGRLSSESYDLSIEGASGQVTLDSVTPPATPGQQRLRVAKVRIGKLEMTDGGVDFQLERTGTVLVERTRWSWAGGRLYTYALRLNPDTPDAVNATVYADKLDLRQLLGVVAEGEATGQGLLYGRLPIRINWPDVSFGEGFLYATGDGHLQIGSKVDTVSAMLDQSDPRFATDPQRRQVKERILDALRDFNYNTLKVDFRQKDDGLTASITVNGKGGKGPNPQELFLTINVNGFDQLLRNAVIIQKVVGSME